MFLRLHPRPWRRGPAVKIKTVNKIFNFKIPILNNIWKKPKIIFVLGESRKKTAETIQNVLGQHFKIGKPPHQYLRIG